VRSAHCYTDRPLLCRRHRAAASAPTAVWPMTSRDVAEEPGYEDGSRLTIMCCYENKSTAIAAVSIGAELAGRKRAELLGRLWPRSSGPCRDCSGRWSRAEPSARATSRLLQRFPSLPFPSLPFPSLPTAPVLGRHGNGAAALMIEPITEPVAAMSAEAGRGRCGGPPTCAALAELCCEPGWPGPRLNDGGAGRYRVAP